MQAIVMQLIFLLAAYLVLSYFIGNSLVILAALVLVYLIFLGGMSRF